MTDELLTDPFKILGVAEDAGEEEVRARYLELVRRHPPDRDPAMFHKIRTAYEQACDPLNIARHLMDQDYEAVEWQTVIDAHRQKPPRMTPAFLLSLGNKDSQARK